MSDYMDNFYMDDFIEKISVLGEDELTLRSLQCAVAAKRAELARATETRWRPHRTKAPMVRIAATAACIIAAVFFGALALAHLLVHNTDDAAAPMQTNIVLTAYAKGTPVDGRDNAIFATEDIFHEGGGYTENSDGSFLKEYVIDPSCMGDGIVSIRYRSTNKNVQLKGSRNKANVLPGESYGTSMLTEITVGEDGTTPPDLDQLSLCVTATAAGENGEVVQLEAGDSPEAWSKKRYLIELAAAQELAKGTLEITATLEDGSTVTLAYRIVPVDNFENMWFNNNASWEAALESGASEFDLKPLYILEQLH